MKKWPHLLALALSLSSCATKSPDEQGHVKLVFEVKVGLDGKPTDISLVSAEGARGSVEAGVRAGEADINTWNFGPERAGTTLRLPFLYSPKKAGVPQIPNSL